MSKTWLDFRQLLIIKTTASVIVCRKKRSGPYKGRIDTVREFDSLQDAYAWIRERHLLNEDQRAMLIVRMEGTKCHAS